MEKTLTAEQLKILVFLKVCKKTHTGYLAKVSQMTYRDVLAILKQLEVQDRVRSTDRGWVSVSEAERQALRAARNGL